LDREKFFFNQINSKAFIVGGMNLSDLYFNPKRQRRSDKPDASPVIIKKRNFWQPQIAPGESPYFLHCN
jgi:hypothetical protein